MSQYLKHMWLLHSHHNSNEPSYSQWLRPIKLHISLNTNRLHVQNETSMNWCTDVLSLSLGLYPKPDIFYCSVSQSAVVAQMLLKHINESHRDTSLHYPTHTHTCCICSPHQFPPNISKIWNVLGKTCITGNRWVTQTERASQRMMDS